MSECGIPAVYGANIQKDLVSFVTLNPDYPLADYRRYLDTEHGIQITEPNISRALHRAGLSQKIVRVLLEV